MIQKGVYEVAHNKKIVVQLQEQANELEKQLHDCQQQVLKRTYIIMALLIPAGYGVLTLLENILKPYLRTL